MRYMWSYLFHFYQIGNGLGVSTTVATVYTMEISTPNMRGRLAVVPAIGNKFSIFMSFGYYTSIKMQF